MSAAENYHEEEVLGKAYDARLMKRLLVYLRPYRRAVAVALVTLLIGSFFQISQAFITKAGVDNYIESGDAAGLGRMALLFGGVMFIMFLAGYAQIYVTAWIGQRVQHDIRMQVFRHLQRLHVGFFDRNPVGRLVTRVTNDVSTLDEMFSSGVVTIIGDIFMLVLIICAMLYINWHLAAITFVAVPLLVTATFLFRARARDAYRMVRLKLARLNAFVQEHLTGMSVVQLFTCEDETYREFDVINRDLQTQHFRSVLYHAVFFPAVEIIGAVSLACLFYFGGYRIADGTLTYGQLVAFIFLVEQFFRPIRDLSEKYNVLQASMASSERIFNLLDTPASIVEKPRPTPVGHSSGGVDFAHVWFAYKDAEWVLKDVTFSVKPGERVAVVGATGAGKTTLVSLLYRFYDYQRGAIKIDGVELVDLPLAEHRSRLGLVLQDVFLFSGDYAGNVRLREPHITDGQVQEALARVGYNRFLEGLPDGIHTEVRERGATLSTGQKQLLSFARALAFDPQILILDEATSSVDSETERLIQTALEELLKGRTSIIIAHRLSTIEKADRIVVLHHGEVREIGRHDELLAQKGIYYRLHQLQYKKRDAASSAASAVTGG